MPEQRFLLTIGYQAGPDPRIQRGADGYRDYFTPEELEKAAWSLLRSGNPTCGLFHMDGTEGAAEIVESSIWRADPWLIKAVDGTDVTVNPGDWLVGLLCDEPAWGLYKRGRVAGVSPQGAAKRRRPSSPPSLAKEFVIAKSVAPVEDGEDEMTELYDAQVPRLDLVGKGANGMPFLIAKNAQGPTGLFDPGYVRGLLAKSEPTSQPQEAVTLSGSPTAIAEVMGKIHAAAVATADVAKAEASTATMNDRPDSDFAYIEPGGHKDEEGRTVPRSLRHFPVYDAAHVRNALSRAPQSPFGDKAMPKIRAAARKFNIDVSKEIDMAVVTGELDDSTDGMDPAVPLAEPDTEAPGDPAEPGSPAWEAIDAATARKWLSIAARLKNALCVLADREMLEAATADPDDAEHALDLQDAMCAVDYAIEQLAVFAACEQAEAELGAEMEAVGKALAAFDPAPLEVIEAIAPLTKAGRVLSAANEAAIRGAVESLQKVLASLPAAPAAEDEGGLAVAKTANEENDMPTPTPSSETTEQSGQAPAMGTAPAAPKPVAGAPVTDVEKADGEKQMVAVYDANGDLVGIVDPGKITPVAGAKKTSTDPDAEDGEKGNGEGDGAPDAAAQDADLTPVPQAEVGTPADAVPDGVAKQQDTAPDAVLKGIAEDVVKAHLGDYSAAHEQALAKQAEQLDAAADVIKALEDRVKALEEQEAVSKVFTNGAVPPPQHLRGQDRGQNLPPVDTSAALVQKRALYGAADATEQNKVALDMQQVAIARLQEIHQQRH